MASPIFNKPAPPKKTPANNEGMALAALAEEDPAQVIITEFHLGLWRYVEHVLRDQGELKFPQRVPEQWQRTPPDVWLVPPKGTDKTVIRGMTSLFESIGATVHEGAPSRFQRPDPI